MRKHKADQIRTALEQAEINKLIRYHDSALIAKHRGLVDKFVQIAERKVAVLDDYGDENWEVLEEEVKRCALKIAKIEGDSNFLLRNLEWSPWTLPAPGGEECDWPKYENLRTNLELEFRAYHEKCKGNPPTKIFDELSGIDFETYLVKVLAVHGFEDITGTPVTGDQGADLLARKGGRKIAIQAKRHKGSVGNAAVQEIVAALKFYQADEGWVITSGTFTESARALAHANSIRLVDGGELRNFQG